MASKISIKNTGANNTAVAVNAQDPTGATNGYFVGQLLGGESADYEVMGSQTLVISEAHLPQAEPEPAPVEVIKPAPSLVPVRSTNFEDQPLFNSQA